MTLGIESDSKNKEKEAHVRDSENAAGFPICVGASAVDCPNGQHTKILRAHNHFCTSRPSGRKGRNHPWSLSQGKSKLAHDILCGTSLIMKFKQTMWCCEASSEANMMACVHAHVRVLLSPFTSARGIGYISLRLPPSVSKRRRPHRRT